MAFFLFPFHFLAFFGELGFGRPSFRLYWHLCVYAPAISAFAVIARRHGFAAVRAYVRRILHWKINVKWYLIVLLGFPAFHAIDRAIFVALGGNAPAYPFNPWYLVIPSVMLSLVGNPAPVEELGWRGFALPLLQKRLSAFQASVLLGAIWGLWHLPAFFLYGGPYTPATFPIYLLQAISYAIIMTALYNATGGNILVAFLFHWQIHDPFHLNAFPHDLHIYTPMLMLVAIAVIFLLGPRNLGREKHIEPLSLPAS